MTQNTNDLGTAGVGRLLLRLAVPAITAQLVNALYNIVDRMYIGHIEGVGDLALTGLGVCFPVLMFISALSYLVGMGGGSRASVRMGEGNMEQANRILGSCTALLVVISVSVTVVFLPLRRPMLYLFGASDNTIDYAVSYITIYLIGTIFVQISLGLNNFITIQGFSTISMLTVILGAAVNIALDPVFIFGFGMGVQGAALATILSQAASAVWVLRFLTGKRTNLKIQRKYFRLDSKILIPVAAIGVSPFIMQSTESLVNIVLNSSLKLYGGDLAVGAMTICSSVMQIFSMPLQGLSQGAQPIVGFNYGAGKLDRVRRVFKLLLISAVIFSVAFWAAVHLFPQAFVALFNDKPELVEITAWALPIYLGGIFIMGVQISCQQTFVALGQAKISLFLALLRKIILLIPLVLILPRIFGRNQVFFVLLAEPIADLLAGVTTGSIFAWRFPRILKRRREALEGGGA